jgi:hypothetical protein
MKKDRGKQNERQAKLIDVRNRPRFLRERYDLDPELTAQHRQGLAKTAPVQPTRFEELLTFRKDAKRREQKVVGLRGEDGRGRGEG